MRGNVITSGAFDGVAWWNEEERRNRTLDALAVASVSSFGTTKRTRRQRAPQHHHEAASRGSQRSPEGSCRVRHPEG